jgi:hypothetical protein
MFIWFKLNNVKCYIISYNNSWDIPSWRCVFTLFMCIWFVVGLENAKFSISCQKKNHEFRSFLSKLLRFLFHVQCIYNSWSSILFNPIHLRARIVLNVKVLNYITHKPSWFCVHDCFVYLSNYGKLLQLLMFQDILSFCDSKSY